MKRILYHTGYQEIREPDVHFGRKNADFGQGFYMTKDPEFAKRWARERRGRETVVNQYELDLTGLCVKTFTRDREWFEYIFRNRAHKADRYPEADIIIGPIANDTIFNTFGILTSGLLDEEQSLRLLLIGPEYEQIVLKSARAAEQLKWISSETLSAEEVKEYRSIVQNEEEKYQLELGAEMDMAAEENEAAQITDEHVENHKR